jgi:hypothetical protein
MGVEQSMLRRSKPAFGCPLDCPANSERPSKSFAGAVMAAAAAVKIFVLISKLL